MHLQILTVDSHLRGHDDIGIFFATIRSESPTARQNIADLRKRTTLVQRIQKPTRPQTQAV